MAFGLDYSHPIVDLFFVDPFFVVAVVVHTHTHTHTTLLLINKSSVFCEKRVMPFPSAATFIIMQGQNAQVKRTFSFFCILFKNNTL